jgi:hypothetical protein
MLLQQACLHQISDLGWKAKCAKQMLPKDARQRIHFKGIHTIPTQLAMTMAE